MDLRRILENAHARVTNAAPTEVVIYQMTYPSSANPYAIGSQASVVRHRTVGTFAPERRAHTPIEEYTTHRGTVSLNVQNLGFIPTQADRIEMGGVIFNVTEVTVVEGVIGVIAVEGPAGDPTGMELPAVIQNGRFPMPDLRSGKFIGQNDVYGRIDTSTVEFDEDDFIEIAKNAVIYTDFDRMSTETGQWVCGRLRDINPDIHFIAYEQFGHVPAGADFPTIPFRQWKKANLPLALGLDGNPVVAWYEGGVQGATVQEYWWDIRGTVPSGQVYDTQMVADYIGEMQKMYDAMEHKPVGLKFDYFNNPTTGYYVWPGESSVDLNQNGVAFASDAEEQAAFEAAQHGFLDEARAAFGPEFLIHGNGRASLPSFSSDATLRGKLNGFFYEKFPISPFGSEPADAMDEFYEALFLKTGGFAPMPNGNVFATTDLEGQYLFASSRANLGRVAAILFGGVWRYQPFDSFGNVVRSDLYDEQFVSDVAALGAPTSDVQKVPFGNNVYWSRTFEGGSAMAQLDISRTGSLQIVTTAVNLL